MSFVTFVRDYIQDPDKIIHIPSFIFDVCKEFLWYVFSFQWLRNLTYVTLSLAYPEGLSSDSGTFYPSLLENVAKTQNNGIVQQNPSSLNTYSERVFSTSLSTTVGDFLASSGLPISIPNSLLPLDIADTKGTSMESNVIAPFLLRTQEGFSFLHSLQEKSMSFLPSISFGDSVTALLTNSAYGFFNGITSNFHFCAITIVIVHIILNENKNRAFKIAAISCLADLSCMVAVLLGFRNLIIPWFAAEPLGYFLGFAIQFYFALEIIKDNRRIKSFDSKDGKKGTYVPDSKARVRPTQISKTLGRLSYNYWLIPSIVLFSWCEQTQFFQTLATNSFQPTATLMGLPFAFGENNGNMSWQSGSNLSTMLASKTTLSPLLPSASSGAGSGGISSLWSSIAFGERELQILVYLLTYVIARIAFTWIGLSIFQKVIDWKSNNYFKPLNWIYNECKFLVKRIANTIKQLVDRPSIQRPSSGNQTLGDTFASPGKERDSSILDGQYSGTLAPPKKIQHILRDPLAIAAVTCSFAFLPSYSTNLLLTKSVGFFPEENRIKHSFFSPWDMPAEVLASDMDFISSHHNLAEYPFFLPFYDKGEYGGWLGVGEEDIRYGPFKLWQTRRIRAPWRRTTLQEPALTYANDKSLFVNPNPNLRKEESTSITFGQPLVSSPLQESSTSFAALPMQPQSQTKNQTVAQNSLLNSTFSSGETKNLSETFLWRTPVTLSNNTITKNGRKRLIEGFKKPVRKMSTSKLFNLSSLSYQQFPMSKSLGSKETSPYGLALTYPEKAFGSKANVLGESKAKNPGAPQRGVGVQSTDLRFNGFDKSQEKGFRAIKYRIGEFINTLAGRKFSNQEVEIKNTKQIRKRFKKFKKRVRLFRSKSYKKRNTKIRRLKHFHYLRNKKKKRRKSRRLIYKLRRQFPYMRNIKERKAEIFGFYSPVISSFWAPYTFPSTTNKENSHSKLSNGLALPFGESDKDHFSSQNPFEPKAFSHASDIEGKVYGIRDESKIQNRNNEKSSYDRGYPKDKNSRNSKKDFNLIFRTQIGERLDFAQEEIRARIFMNPYIRFLLNKRIDNFLSREKKDFLSSSSLPYTQGKERTGVKDKVQSHSSFLSSIPFASNTANKVQSAKLTADAEEKLFKRRLIISKYADAIDFLKPNSRHSYVDRIYNHQFKGTLSTARRLFSLKVQYDQPLVHPKNYEPILEHEDFTKNATPSSEPKAFGDASFASLASTSKPKNTYAKLDRNNSESSVPYPEGIARETLTETEGMLSGESKFKKEADKYSSLASLSPELLQSHKMKEYDQGSLLEKSSTVPFYAAWDPELRKLVFTNRYLNHKSATKGMEQSSSPIRSANPYSSLSDKKEKQERKNHHQQFTSWPLKESYFKDNEYLVSQLYSNSQPIDSFLSQENEKARPVTLPRRVSSFNTILSYKNSVPPTDAQRSQQLFRIENNDRKTFLFKHLWTSSNTAVSFKGESSLSDNKKAKKAKEDKFINKNKYKLPTSAEQRKTTRMEEREYPLWMVLRTLAPNQGGFLWPGD